MMIVLAVPRSIANSWVNEKNPIVSFVLCLIFYEGADSSGYLLWAK